MEPVSGRDAVTGCARTGVRVGSAARGSPAVFLDHVATEDDVTATGLLDDRRHSTLVLLQLGRIGHFYLVRETVRRPAVFPFSTWIVREIYRQHPVFFGAGAGAADPHPHPAPPVDFTSASRAQQASVPVGAGPPQHPFAAAGFWIVDWWDASAVVVCV